MSEAAVGPVALGAAQAEAALAQTGDILGGMSVDPDDRTPLAIRNTGAEIVTYGAPVLPGAMFLVSYLDGVPDGQRGAVVRVHAHAAGGKDQLTACGLCFQNGGRDARRVIVADLVEGHLTAIHRQLLLEDGSKLVLNTALESKFRA